MRQFPFPPPSHSVLLLSVALLVGLVAQPSSAGVFARLFAPKAELWEKWQAHAPDDQRTIDHAPWTGFLTRYVETGDDGVARVGYARVSAADRESLVGYIKALADTEISGYSRAVQFAYWVNLYNALTVRVVLDHLPVDSIRDIDISPGLFANGPWGKTLVEVEGERVSLNDIEHRILRPIWQDPRIHYAVNCASIGCPNLQPEAFDATNTERLLEAAARGYINDQRGVQATDEGLVLSSIYEWFADDFDADGGVVAHLRRYAGPELQERLDASASIKGYAYDWSLNGL